MGAGDGELGPPARMHVRPKEWTEAARAGALCLDPTHQSQLQRCDMHTKVESTHAGEPRWSNVDSPSHETVSSTCAGVGFDVGYNVTLAVEANESCAARRRRAETSVDWAILPPFCRRGDVGGKHAKLGKRRDTDMAERGQAFGSRGVGVDSDRKSECDNACAERGASQTEVDFGV